MKNKILGVVCLLVIAGLFLLHDRIYVEYLTWNDVARKKYVESPSHKKTIFLLIDRARSIDGYKGYEILSDCYVGITQIFETSNNGFSLEEKKLIHRAFGGYTNLHYGDPEYEHEKLRYEKIIRPEEMRDSKE